MQKHRKKQIFLIGFSIILLLIYKIVLYISDQQGYVLIEPYRTNFLVLLIMLVIVAIVVSVIIELSDHSSIIKNDINDDANNEKIKVKNTIFFVIALKAIAVIQLIAGIILSIIILQDTSNLIIDDLYIKIISISIIISSIIVFIFLMLVSYTAENIAAIRVNSYKVLNKKN
ncbi:hypothetical protein ACSVC9_11985 [Clostridium sp. LBM24168]